MEHFYPQIDVYALAATLVYALSGTHLPDSRSLTPDMVRDILPTAFPETLVSAILNALNPDVTQRTASVTNFREELKEFRANSAANARVKSRELEEETDGGSVNFIDAIKKHWWKYAIAVTTLAAIIKVVVS